MQISLLRNMLGYLTARRQGAVCPRGAVSQTNLSPARAIASARDDPARSMLLSAVRTETARAGQAGRNAVHGISMVQAADDALARMEADLDEALALAQQAAEGGQGEAELACMQTEFGSLLDGLDAIAASVDFDGTNLLTATSEVVLSLARPSVDPSTEIRVRTQALSVEALGLTGAGSDPTYATLRASSGFGVDSVDDDYLRGPAAGDPGELTFTFGGSQGDKAVTIYILKKKSLTETVDMINSEMGVQVPGWSGAEAVQVDGKWVLKVSTYEAGESDAPTAAVSGSLDWYGADPVLPSHFIGQGGSAGSEGVVLTASDTVGKLEDAIDEVAALRSDFAVAIQRLWFAGSAFESGTGSSLAAESRINGADITEATATATSRVMLSRGSTALLLQGNVTARAALQLLGLPAVDEPESVFFSLRA